MDRRIIFLFFLFFLLFGCIEKSIYPSENEVISSERSVDLDNDGIPDQYIYTFEPKYIENVSVQREILVQRKIGNLVLVRLTLTSEKTEKITDITLREIIPSALSLKLTAINFSTKYSEVARSEPPITVVWKYTFSGGEKVVKTIEYGVLAYQEITRSWVEKNIRSPDIEVGVLDPKTAAVYIILKNANDSYFEFLKSIIDFYIAVGLYAATLFAIFLVFLEVLAVIAAFLASIIKRKKFKDEVFNWIGRGRKDNPLWIVAGILFIIAGIIIIFISGEAMGSSEMSTLIRLGSNIQKSLGSVAILLGIVSITYVILDNTKGAIFGKRYYLEPIDIARGQLRTLIGRLEELGKVIYEYAAEGIDTSAEQIIMEVEQRRAEKIEKEIDEENVDIFTPIIAKSISDVEAAIEGLSTKREILKRWPEWKAIIDEMLSSKDKITPNELIQIPERWRKWALTKYLSEHLGEALSLEEGALTKIKIAAIGKSEIEAILADFMRAGKIEGTAVVRKDGLVVAARLPKEVDPNLVAAIAAKVVANAEMVSSELERGNTNFTILRSTGGETLIYEGKKIILIALIKIGENTGYVISEAEKIIKKLNEMF